MKRSMRWSQKELEQLKELIAQQSTRSKYDWISISKTLGNRTPRQCYDAFQLQLAKNTDPDVYSRHFWTKEEVDILLTFKEAKQSWKDFQSACFPHLSMCQIKNKYRQLTLKKENNSFVTYQKMSIGFEELRSFNSTPIASTLEEAQGFQYEIEGNLIDDYMFCSFLD